jgi:NAD(P)-dependent dehydrogenase (short-subunit alcohol dehydrogenase family)
MAGALIHSARFAEQVVLVVGGGADGPPRAGDTEPMGNGRAIALRLAAEGGRVAVTDISRERAEQTVAAMPTRGLAIASDIGDPLACRAAVEQTEAELGPIDVVVLNVAISSKLPLRAQGLDDWQRNVDVNVRGHWVTAQAALDPMLQRGRGNFVFVGSTGGVLSSGVALAYEATKAAQLAVMRHIAVRYAARGLRSNAVLLGVIDSTLVRRAYGDTPEDHVRRGQVVPMRREGRPEEAAAAAAFLASDDASYVNGHCLVVDGGVSAAWPSPIRPTEQDSPL